MKARSFGLSGVSKTQPHYGGSAARTEERMTMHSIKPSLRSRVAPFMAMDVMSASRKLEAAGADIVHMELGEPAAPAPRDRKSVV